ncbi:MAG: SpoIIE family protein phosphatase [Pseudomonadota bacterium]
MRPLDLPDKAPLGWRRDDVYDTASLTLAPGDTVVMFTDGVTEAPEPVPDDEPPRPNFEFGYERAVETVQDMAGKPAAEVLEALETRIKTHLAGGEPIDDTTILVMVYQGQP